MFYLRDIRKSRGLTMKQLGEMVGITEAAIGNYETERRSVNYEMLLKLSEALECSVEDLLYGEKNPAHEEGEVENAIIKLKHNTVISLFDKASPADQEFVLNLLARLAHNQEAQDEQ